MLNQSFKIITILVMFGMVLPAFSLAQEQSGAAIPQTIGEAKGFAMEILTKLPDTIKRIWEGEALPIWKKMWEWFLGLWKSTIWPMIEPQWNKEVEKRRPAIEEEIRKEKEEIKEDLWQRFKELLSDKL